MNSQSFKSKKEFKELTGWENLDRKPNESWDQLVVRKMGEEREEKDLVNHPSHYNKGIETSNYIKSWDMNWNQANVVKYVTRYNLKNIDKKLQIQDLEKAQWYLNDLINDLKN